MSDYEFQQAVTSLEVAALNFAARFTNDVYVRNEYTRLTAAMSRELRTSVSSGTMTPSKAAEVAHQMRNEILEMSRAKTSDFGLAGAKKLKAKGVALDDLVEKYSGKKFGRTFKDLTKGQQDEVMMEIVESAGRARPSATLKVQRLGRLAKGLWVLSAAIAIYNIGTAEDKVDQTGREAANLGGGVLGGAAGGAAAGIWFGPVGVAVGICIGGALGALMADQVYVDIRGQRDAEVAEIIEPHTNFAWTDEEAIAKDLVDKAGIDTGLVARVLDALTNDYSGDVDDVARLYVARVRKTGGTLEMALRFDQTLRQKLIRAMDDGWTTSFEKSQISFLKKL